MPRLLNEDRIRRDILRPVGRLVNDVSDVAAGAGAQLRSALLYGSVVGKHFVPGKSDVNILLVFDKVGLDLMRKLRGVFRNYTKDLRGHPVVLDMEYIEDSRDVFPMEFLEWKERHILILGDDFLSGLEVSLDNLRHELEENLRGKKLRLIQSYFEMEGRREGLQGFLQTTLPGFLVYIRNILRLINFPVSDDVPAMLTLLEERTGLKVSSVRRLYQCRAERIKLGAAEAELLFSGYLKDVDGLIEYVDKFQA